MITIETQVKKINELHAGAISAANTAVELARQAGELLLGVKKTLPHGQFLPWVEKNTTVTARQAQRYMDVAKGKPTTIRQLTGKYDTVSHLDQSSKNSEGIWVGDQWEPEQGCQYIFKDETGAYFVSPSSSGGFHLCKHYSGQRMSSEGFYWRYTVFSGVNDPDLTSEFYVGTRSPILLKKGLGKVLASYGLKDLKSALVLGGNCVGLDRPFGEPSEEFWYWDSEKPDDGLFQVLEKQNHLNSRGAITFI